MPCAFRFAIKTTNNAARSGTGSGVSTGGPSAPHPPHHRFGILRYPQDFSLCGFPTIASISIRFSFVAGLLHFSHALGMSQKLKLNARGWPIRLKLITLSPPGSNAWRHFYKIICESVSPGITSLISQLLIRIVLRLKWQMFVWGVAQEVQPSLSGRDIHTPTYLFPFEVEEFIWVSATSTNELVCLFTQKFRQRWVGRDFSSHGRDKVNKQTWSSNWKLFFGYWHEFNSMMICLIISIYCTGIYADIEYCRRISFLFQINLATYRLYHFL